MVDISYNRNRSTLCDDSLMKYSTKNIFCLVLLTLATVHAAFADDLFDGPDDSDKIHTIGIEFESSKKDGGPFPIVHRVVPGSPAFKAGIQKKTAILTVNGISASHLTPRELILLIANTKGTKLSLETDNPRKKLSLQSVPLSTINDENHKINFRSLDFDATINWEDPATRNLLPVREHVTYFEASNGWQRGNLDLPYFILNRAASEDFVILFSENGSEYDSLNIILDDIWYEQDGKVKTLVGTQLVTPRSKNFEYLKKLFNVQTLPTYIFIEDSKFHDYRSGKVSKDELHGILSAMSMFKDFTMPGLIQD